MVAACQNKLGGHPKLIF